MNTNHSDEKLYYTAVSISNETSFSMRAEERDQNSPNTQKNNEKNDCPIYNIQTTIFI